MEIALIAALFACIGSFLNVVISRLPRQESLVVPRSRCPECRGPIPLWHNIPILSYLVLAGKCAKCGTGIPLRYLIVEILTPVLAVAVLSLYGLSWEFLKFSLLILLLIPAAFIDLDHRLLLNKITIPGIVLGLAISITIAPELWYQPVLGMIAGGGMLALVALIGQLLFKQESMGGGDIKFGAMIGAFMTADAIIISLLLAFALAALFSLIGMAIGVLKRRSMIPFGPFIALGALVSVGFKNQLFDIYLIWVGLK